VIEKSKIKIKPSFIIYILFFISLLVVVGLYISEKEQSSLNKIEMDNGLNWSTG
jgi:hypothetical protein